MHVPHFPGVLSVLALKPDPFKPNTDDIPNEVVAMYNKLLGFVTWTVTGLCVAGIMIVAGRMAISHRRGEASEHLQGLKWVAAACLVASSASLIANAVVA